MAPGIRRRRFPRFRLSEEVLRAMCPLIQTRWYLNFTGS